jgi:hypothetical protein
MPRTIEIKVITDTKQAEASAERVKRAFRSALDPAQASVASLRSAFGGLNSVLITLGGAAAFKQIAQFGIDLDRARNTMTALTGSVTAANAKLAELRELAKASPGVTNTFATQLFNQLKAIGGIADQTINTVIKSLGKLNTVFADVGPEFSRNLIQIFTQGFERADIKEALGRVPIFEQLLERAFGTKDPEKLRKLKEAGALTLNSFLTGFSDAIQNDPRFKNIQESLGGKLQKSFDETKIKLAELGEKLLQTLIPALDKLIPLLNTMLNVFSKLPDTAQAAAVGILLVAPAINTLTGAVTGLRAAMIGLGAFLTSPAGVAALGLVGLATAGFALNDLISNQIPANVRSQLGLGDRSLLTGETPGNLGIGGIPGFRLEGGKFVRDVAKKTPPTGIGGAGRGGTAEPSAQAQEIADLTRKIAEERARFGEGLVEDLTQISNAINEANAESDKLFRGDRLKEQRLSRAALTADLDRREGIAKEAEKARKEIEKLPPILSDSQRFMQGFANATQTVGDAFERFGANVAQAFGNVRNLFNGLKQAVLGFFNDLLGSSIQNLVRGVLGPIFGGGGGGGGGLLGNLFRTPSFAGGGGISAPGSISGGSLGQIFAGGASSGGGLGSIVGGILGGGGGAGGGSAAGGFGGFNFSGLGQSLGNAAPLLGLGIGASLGGKSIGGNILGAAGGLLTSTFLATTLGAPGALGSLAPALFSNPFTAIAGAGLLVGAVLLGKAAQRKKDEEASGQMLTQALSQIRELKAGIDSGSIDGSQARAIFENQILAQFIQGINSLKTESVRKSRLTNQVADLRRVFNELIEPSIAAQAARQAEGLAAQQRSAANAAIFARQIPEFATGGTTRGGLAVLHPGEKIVNLQQQATMRAIAGPNIFERAGVPGPSANRNFDIGGTMPVGQGGQADQPIVIEQLVIAYDGERAAIKAMSGAKGRQVIINQVRDARTDKEL